MADNEASLLIKIKQVGQEVLDKFVITLGDVMNAVKATGEFLYSFVEAYAESEEATNKLSQAMVNQGMYSSELRKKYEDQAAALQGLTTFADDQIVNAQAILQGFVGQREVSEQLTKATLDLAAAKKMDLASAAEVVGKAINNGTESLKRYGIEAEDSTDKAERMGNIIQSLSGKFGGQAQAAAKGLGSIQQLKNSFNDFQEAVGKRLAPVIGLIVQSFTDFFKSFSGGGSTINMFIASIQSVAQVFLGLYGVVELVGKLIGTWVGGMVGIFGNLIQGNFKAALENAKTYVSEMGNSFVDSYTKTKDRIATLNESFMGGIGENLQKEEELEKKSLENKLANRTEYHQKLATLEEEQALLAQQKQLTDYEMESLAEDNKHAALLEKKIQFQDKLIQQEQNHAAKMNLIKERGTMVEQLIEKKKNEATIKDREDTGKTIATLSQSSNKSLAAIGKAAAMTQIAIDTPAAVSKAMAAFPPPFNFAAAGLVGAAMAAQAAKVAGVQLADGGIVRATPGGIQATIGEGGRDEAVIPLDSPEAMGRLGGGGQVTVIFQGPVMGDEAQAMEFARHIDKSLLRLRQSNQSVAFEDLF